MNKHFNINYAEQESDWKDLTIINLLSEVSDLEDRIDKAIEYIGDYENYCDENECDCTPLYFKELLDILKGSDKE